MMVPEATEDYSRPSQMFSLETEAFPRSTSVETKNSFQALLGDHEDDFEVPAHFHERDFPQLGFGEVQSRQEPKMGRWKRPAKPNNNTTNTNSYLPYHVEVFIDELCEEFKAYPEVQVKEHEGANTFHHLAYLGEGKSEAMVSHVVDGSAGEWEELCMVMDSGAADAVAPCSVASSVPVVESLGSRVGQNFMTADGTRLPNKGQKSVVGVSEEGQKLGFTFQMADVSRPLASIGKICDKNKVVLFTKQGGFVLDLASRERTRFNREEGVYLMRTWIPKTNSTSSRSRREAPSFTRQG